MSEKKDVDMKTDEKKDKIDEKKDKIDEKKDSPPKPQTPSEIQALVLDDLKKNIGFIEKTVSTKEPRFLTRVLRKIAVLRKKLTLSIFQKLLDFYWAEDLSFKTNILQFLSKIPEDAPLDLGEEKKEDEMKDEIKDEKKPEEKKPEEKKDEVKKDQISPVILSTESEVFVQLLLTIFLIDRNYTELACECSKNLISRIEGVNRRMLLPLAAKAFFYFCRAFEPTPFYADIRPTLLVAQRTASLRHDDEGQATLLNLLVRNYLHFNLYDQANKLVSKTTFPEAASSNQSARFLYYQGRISAIQLDYSESLKHLVQAQRKAPQTAARGFRLTVSKLVCIVRLLLGEIPERSFYRQTGLKFALKPYLHLTQAVRVGDLKAFHVVVDKYQNTFKEDKTYTLIQRLRQNVIKTGLKKINVAYSRIHLTDICAKLHLESVEDAESIVAKAIRDGVIDASIDHENGFIQSKESPDVYSTQEPQEAYHKRVAFCLNIHNESVKAMRYPPDAHKPNKETEETRKARLQQELEIASSLADDDGEEDEDEEF